MLLQLENIRKGFGNVADQSYRPVLEDLTLEVKEGERIAILGPSGSGKTTLLNLIGGLDHPDQGSVKFQGENITGYTESQMDYFRNDHIGFVFQQFFLLPTLTALENVQLPSIFGGNKKAGAEDRAKQLLERVGLNNRAEHFPSQLSGGEMQRVAIARSLIGNPSLLLADEPTGNLDSDNAKTVMELLKSLNNDGVTVLFVAILLPLYQYAISGTKKPEPSPAETLIVPTTNLPT